MNGRPRFVLASSSPSRLRVLRDAGFDPEVIVSGVSEEIEAATTEDAVLALARRKGLEVRNQCADALVLACDSMLDFQGKSLGKPDSPAQVIENWRLFSGKDATLCTGHWLADTRSGRSVQQVGRTIISFGSPTDAELNAYLDTGEPLHSAGGFTIEGFGAPFVERIDGSPSNVLGLSLSLLRSMLDELGIAISQLWR